MKKRFQLIALLAVALLGACSGGKDKVAVEQVDEKPRVKLADVKARPVEQIHEYTATVEAEVKNNNSSFLSGTHRQDIGGSGRTACPKVRSWSAWMRRT